MAPSSKAWDIYRDPVTDRYYDPYRVLAALYHYSGNKLNEMVRAANESPAGSLKLAEVGRRAFGLPAIDPATGEGTPDAVVLAVVEKFSEYVRGKGQGAGNWRNWSRPSEASPLSSMPRTSLPSGLLDPGCRPCGRG
jgi:hypothetical protein